MKIYLAGPLSAAWTLNRFAQHLTAQGHVITSRWIRQPRKPPAPVAVLAAQDLEDIDTADVVIHFTQRGKHFGGARHLEAGYALGKGKRLVIYGPRENLFYHLPHVVHATTWQELLRALA